MWALTIDEATYGPRQPNTRTAAANLWLWVASAGSLRSALAGGQGGP
jgi:hypothetical protein